MTSVLRPGTFFTCAALATGGGVGVTTNMQTMLATAIGEAGAAGFADTWLGASSSQRNRQYALPTFLRFRNLVSLLVIVEICDAGFTGQLRSLDKRD